MEPPDAERVAVGSRDHSSLKECVRRRNLISQSVSPGVDISHRKVACTTQVLFSSDAQLHSCHKYFSHYRQPPPSLQQSVLIFERYSAANAKALIFLNLLHPTYGPSQLHRDTVASIRYSTPAYLGQTIK